MRWKAKHAVHSTSRQWPLSSAFATIRSWLSSSTHSHGWSTSVNSSARMCSINWRSILGLALDPSPFWRENTSLTSHQTASLATAWSPTVRRREERWSFWLGHAWEDTFAQWGLLWENPYSACTKVACTATCEKWVQELISDLQVVSEVANEVGLRTEPTIELLGHVTSLFRAHQLLLLLLVVVHE